MHVIERGAVQRHPILLQGAAYLAMSHLEIEHLGQRRRGLGQTTTECATSVMAEGAVQQVEDRARVVRVAEHVEVIERCVVDRHRSAPMLPYDAA